MHTGAIDNGSTRCSMAVFADLVVSAHDERRLLNPLSLALPEQSLPVRLYHNPSDLAEPVAQAQV
jgi:hypothetical protein